MIQRMDPCISVRNKLGSMGSLDEFHIRGDSLVEHQAYRLHKNTQLDHSLRDTQNTAHMDSVDTDAPVQLASAYTARMDFRSNLAGNCRKVCG